MGGGQSYSNIILAEKKLVSQYFELCLLSYATFNILFVWTKTPLAISKSLGVDNDDVFHL